MIIIFFIPFLANQLKSEKKHFSTKEPKNPESVKLISGEDGYSGDVSPCGEYTYMYNYGQAEGGPNPEEKMKYGRSLDETTKDPKNPKTVILISGKDGYSGAVSPCKKYTYMYDYGEAEGGPNRSAKMKYGRSLDGTVKKE